LQVILEAADVGVTTSQQFVVANQMIGIKFGQAWTSARQQHQQEAG
jgi:hypothetical protein